MSELAELTQVSATGILGAQAFEHQRKEAKEKNRVNEGTVRRVKTPETVQDSPLFSTDY